MGESTKVLCDNEIIVNNCTSLESTLAKKHNAIVYHTVRWNVAAVVIYIAWIDGKNNLVDAMTKRIAGDEKREVIQPMDLLISWVSSGFLWNAWHSINTPYPNAART